MKWKNLKSYMNVNIILFAWTAQWISKIKIWIIIITIIVVIIINIIIILNKNNSASIYFLDIKYPLKVGHDLFQHSIA